MRQLLARHSHHLRAPWSTPRVPDGRVTWSLRGGSGGTGRAGGGPPHGEERPTSRRRGSGTIFFAWCNLRCVFCQNWELSQRGDGSEVQAEGLAAMMLELQEMGCHNVNLVTPSDAA